MGTVIACSLPERSLPSSVWIPKRLPGGQHRGESVVSVLPAGTGATGKLRYELYSASTVSRLRQFLTRLSDPADALRSSRSETGAATGTTPAAALLFVISPIASARHERRRRGPARSTRNGDWLTDGLCGLQLRPY
jgi:hypothetical protein